MTVFTVLWAIATLFHLGSYNQWATHFHRVVLTGSALLALARPRVTAALLFLATTQLYELWYHLPASSNHWVFTGFCNLGLLAAWSAQVTTEGSFRVDRDGLWQKLSGIIRLNLTVLYLFVVFHKLNTDYFNIDLSCGTQFWEAQQQLLPFLPGGDTWRWTAIAGTVAAEAAIPLLMWLPKARWRLSGILLAVLFHGMIGFNPQSGFYNFSSVIYASIFAFAAPQLIMGLSRFSRIRHSLHRRIKSFSLPTRISVLAAFLLGGFWYVSLLDWSWMGQPQLLRLLWAVFLVTSLAVTIFAMGYRCPNEQSLSVLPSPKWVLFIPIVVVLNGLSPYIGLKSETSFAMYANLRTEGGKSNHYIVPASIQFFDYQQRLVHVTESSVPGVADRHHLWTEFELRRIFSSRPQASLTYRRDGKTVDLDPVRKEPRFVEPLTPIEAKLLQFRRVPKAKEHCSH